MGRFRLRKPFRPCNAPESPTSGPWARRGAPPLRRGFAAPRREPHAPTPPLEERRGENPDSQFPERRQYRDPLGDQAGDKIMRRHAQTATIENGFVHLPEATHWLPDHLAEFMLFPNARTTTKSIRPRSGWPGPSSARPPTQCSNVGGGWRRDSRVMQPTSNRGLVKCRRNHRVTTPNHDSHQAD